MCLRPDDELHIVSGPPMRFQMRALQTSQGGKEVRCGQRHRRGSPSTLIRLQRATDVPYRAEPVGNAVVGAVERVEPYARRVRPRRSESQGRLRVRCGAGRVSWNRQDAGFSSVLSAAR